MSETGVPRAFDEFAGEYDQLLADPLRNRFTGADRYFIDIKCRALLRELRSMEAPGRPLRVLDAGCGRGAAFPFLREHLRLFGSDVSYSMVRDAVGFGPVTVQEPFDLPFRDRTFDAVFAFCVYHHIDVADHLRHLRELSRVVNNGGRVFVFEHNPINPITRRVFNRAPIDRGCRMIRREALESTFHEAGLQDITHGYVLFVPQALSRVLGFIEPALSWLPLGAQYFVSGRRRRS